MKSSIKKVAQVTSQVTWPLQQSDDSSLLARWHRTKKALGFFYHGGSRTTFSPLSNNLESLKWRDILGKVSQAIVGSSWSYATRWGLKVALKDLLEIRKSLTWLSKMSKIRLKQRLSTNFLALHDFIARMAFFPRWKKWIERSRSWVSFDDVTGLTDGFYRCVIWAQ